MRKRAYLFAREMVWKRVAQGYMESFSRVRSDRMESPKVQFSARLTEKSPGRLPELKLNQLHRLTDDTGMLQHAIFTIPNRREGYTTDDNARALIFSLHAGANGERWAAKDQREISIHLPQIPLGCISRFWNMRSIPRREGSRTFSATIAGGMSLSDPKIVMDGHCGRLEPF